VLVMIFVLNVFGLTKISNAADNYFSRLTGYLYSTSKESRVQFEALLLTFFFFFLY